MKSVQQAIQANHQRLLGKKLERGIHVLSRRLQVAAKQGRLRPKPEEILVLGAFPRPNIKFPLCTFQVSVPKIGLRDVLVREVLRVPQSRPFVGASGLLEPADVRADRAQPVVCVIQVGLERQSLLYLRDGFNMAEISGLTPQNVSSR